MKALDRYLRDVRIGKARPFLERGDVVVDVGCGDGAMFEQWRDVIEYGYGVDPILEGRAEHSNYILQGGLFPDALAGVRCDLITMLAVLEHVPADAQRRLADACYEMLLPGGRLVITVPSPRVDAILAILTRLRLIDGMSLDEHYGFDPHQVPQIFAAPMFRPLRRDSFQFGLNHLFAFERGES